MKTPKMRLAKFQRVQIVFVLLVLWIVPLSAFGQATPSPAQAPTAELAAATERPKPTPVREEEVANLDSVIKQVQAALDDYQKSLGSGPDALPPLTSADFDFRATAGTTAGGSINLFIFKFGGSHKEEVMHQVTYTYTVPPVASFAGKGNKPPPTLTQELVNTVKSAAAAVKTAKTMGKLQFSKLAVTIQYSVTWSGNGGINVPVSFVTIGLNGELSKNTVQSVKLTFGK